MDIDEFRWRKEKMHSLKTEIDEANLSFNQEQVHLLTSKYIALQEELLSYDLSDIPYEEWNDITVFSNPEGVIDFSKTHANIDFSIITFPGFVNFKGCHLKNIDQLYPMYLNPSYFDEEVIKNNSSLFLSDIFPEDFKEKYYRCELSISDLISLSSIQLEELLEKNIELHLISNERLSSISEVLIIPRRIEYYQMSPEIYETVRDLLNITPFYLVDWHRMNIFIDSLKELKLKDIKEACFSFFRDDIICRRSPIVLSNYPPLFQKENKDILLLDVDIDEDVRERYYQKKLTFSDVIQNRQIFENIPLDFFFSYDMSASQMISKYGVGKFQKLIFQYPDVFRYLEEINIHSFAVLRFCQELISAVSSNLEENFYDAIKDYIVFDMEKRDGSISHQIPNWASSLPFHLIDYIQDAKDLLQCDNYAILVDNNQRKALRYLGIENIRHFEEEYGIFSQGSRFSDHKTIFDIICDYLSNFRYTYRSEFPFRFSQGELPYEEFVSTFVEFLEELQFHYGAFGDNGLDSLEGKIREEQKELFMDYDAPQELRKAFYQHKISFQMIYDHPEYVPFLLDKKLYYVLEDNMPFQLSDGVSFVEEYSSRFGNQEMLNLISKYGSILSKISLDYRNFDYYSKDEIDNIVLQNIIKKVITSRDSYQYLSLNEEFRSAFPDLFLDLSSSSLSEEEMNQLSNAFYRGECSFQMIQENPQFLSALKHKNLSMAFRFMESNWRSNYTAYGTSMFPVSDDMMLEFGVRYGKYLDSVIESILNSDIKSISNLDYEMFDQIIDEYIYKKIFYEGLEYHPDELPSSFLERHPELFLKSDIDSNFQNQFYKKSFTLDDFLKNPDYLELVGDTPITLGLPSDYCWTVGLFQQDGELANYYRLKVCSEYQKLSRDSSLSSEFVSYLISHQDDLNKDTIDEIGGILNRLSKTNSTSLFSIRKTLAGQLLRLEHPLESYEKIEKIFLRNHLPLYGKMFYCFQILYPDFTNSYYFDFSHNSRISPELKDETLGDVKRYDGKSSFADKRFQIIYNDLLRIAIQSNSSDLRRYLDSLEDGDNLYRRVIEDNLLLSNLSNHEIETLNIFEAHLEMIYENTKKGQNDSLQLDSLDLLDKIKILENRIGPTSRYDLKDRIVRMFAYSAGYKSYHQLREAMDQARDDAHKRGLSYAHELKLKPFQLEDGDFLRCIGTYESFGGSLDNGNFSKEFLSTIKGMSTSDTTPLDIDWTRIKDRGDIYHSVEGTPTGFGFGNVYLVMKRDNPSLHITRDSFGNLIDSTYDPSKIEMFGTQIRNEGYETHWGSRTGIAMSDVDYILYKKGQMIDCLEPYLENGDVHYTNMNEYYYGLNQSLNDLDIIKFEIVRHGYYIPIVDFSGKQLFPVEEYYSLRKQMEGLSYYGENSYHFSSHLDIPSIEISNNSFPSVLDIVSQLDESEAETSKKREKIIQILSGVFDKYHLSIKTKMDGDISPGSVEVIDTGSTSRMTNQIGVGDFDFLLRLDSNICMKKNIISSFQKDVMDAFSKYQGKINLTSRGDLRCKDVHLDDDTIVDIDISFDRKTDKVSYSTDECIKDRLDTIRNISEDKYRKVLANIIIAKQVLKMGGVYKSKNSATPQGGLGGVGIENWILQHGGSFIDAARSFIDIAEGKSFDDFKMVYSVWDFGENHTAERKNHYLHDNYVYDNMDASGFLRMVSILKEYLQQYDLNTTIEEDTNALDHKKGFLI